MKKNAIKSSVLITSKQSNRYLFDKNKKTLTINHPIFHQLVQMEQQGVNLESWLNESFGKSLIMDGIGKVLRKDVLYYYRKILLLKENGYFIERNMGENGINSLHAKEIDLLLANVSEIVFEVTQKCNLKCQYCAYGEFYDKFGLRGNRDLDIMVAERALKFVLSKIKSPLNRSHRHELHIGFYGGEPLINFPLIAKIVNLFGQKDMKESRIKFVMTTNGLLLDKYMDFLVKHRFRLLISLDGDEQGNGYRVFENGKPAYANIVRNVKSLKKKHPKYFTENVNFNAVVHDRNSVLGIFNYFKKEFSKVPELSQLTPLGIKNEMKERFKKMYQNIYENVKSCHDSGRLEEELAIQLPHLRDLFGFICFQQFFVFANHRQLIAQKENCLSFPTGTCQPFSKKIFLTAEGTIFPCERIGQLHTLGKITDIGMDINTDSIAKSYNLWFERIGQQCISCYNMGECPVCIYYIDDFPELHGCKWHTGYEKFSRTVSENIDILENHSDLYTILMNNN